DDRQDADADEHPEPRAGVEHLAQLDLDESGGGDRGGHAATPSRWVSAVSDRNMSSSPAPSADRSSVRATPAARAAAPTRVGSASVRTEPSPARVLGIPARSSA